jgi:hypothetical protein
MTHSAFEQSCLKKVNAASAKAREIAAERLAMVTFVEALELVGNTRSAGVVAARIRFRVSTRTVWHCLSRVDGVGPSLIERLAYLLPAAGQSL